MADADLYLDLDLRGVAMLEFDVVEPVVEAGYRAAIERIEFWLRKLLTMTSLARLGVGLAAGMTARRYFDAGS